MGSETQARSRSYVGRHWRGQLSLARSWWFGALVYFSVSAIVVSSGVIEQEPIFAVGPLLLYVWFIVGIWRAAGKHRGLRVWAIVARALVIISFSLAAIYNVGLVLDWLIRWASLENFTNPAILIKMKPTVLYLIYAAVLLGGKPPWRTLTWRWAAFFLVLAFVNEFVWRYTSTDVWVAFKIWGAFPATLLFALTQIAEAQKLAREWKPKVTR